jgi:acyl phosphate:glycerol-3-phosphate acyltransferase
LIVYIILSVIYVLGAYLLGSVSQLFALARLRRVKLDGDYHMSLWQKAGLTLAVVGILLEFFKGALAILAGRWLGFDISVISIAGVAVVCGQMWPVFQKFDGEKGNTVGLGMAGALSYKAIICGIIPVAIGAAVRTFPRLFGKRGQHTSILGGSNSLGLPLGMLVGFLVLPLASWRLQEPAPVTGALAAVFVLILVRRLTAGIRDDLKVSTDFKRIFWGRLLLDRGVSRYRVNNSANKVGIEKVSRPGGIQ